MNYNLDDIFPTGGHDGHDGHDGYYERRGIWKEERKEKRREQEKRERKGKKEWKEKFNDIFSMYIKIYDEENFNNELGFENDEYENHDNGILNIDEQIFVPDNFSVGFNHNEKSILYIITFNNYDIKRIKKINNSDRHFIRNGYFIRNGNKVKFDEKDVSFN